MVYYIQTRDGKILKGKANTWNEVWRGLPLGAKLYNPYTQKTVIGWNLYKQQIATAQRKKYRK